MPELGSSIVADASALKNLADAVQDKAVDKAVAAEVNSDLGGLFSELKVRDVVFPNRIGVPPMCMYSCDDTGAMIDFHLVQYASYIMGGVGLVTIEAAAVEPEGRLSNKCVGLYNEDTLSMLKKLVDLAHATTVGCKIGVQLGHGGRKAGCYPIFEKGFQHVGIEGFERYSPSDLPFEGIGPTKMMTLEDMERVKNAFVKATERMMEIDMDFIEIHGAHGYLIHQFLSPASNKRTDEYGGSFENRIKFPLEVCRAVRAAMPEGKPLMIRLSATDLTPHEEDQWDVEDCIKFCQLLEEEDIVQMFSISSGGLSYTQNLSILRMAEEGYQVHYAEAVRKALKKDESVVLTAGGIVNPEFANSVVTGRRADMVLVGREALRNPRFGLNWSMKLDAPVKPERQIAPGYMMSSRKKALLAKMAAEEKTEEAKA